MNQPHDPYDKAKLLDALVKHAWDELGHKKDHRPAFEAMGISTREQLREVIEKCLDASDTRAFRAQPVNVMSQTKPREIYELPIQNAAGDKPVVILNPNLKDGLLIGGTCYVPDKDGKTFDRLLEAEALRKQNVASNWTPRTVLGGRPALREQEQHQRLSTELKNSLPILSRNAELDKIFDRLLNPAPRPKENTSSGRDPDEKDHSRCRTDDDPRRG